MSHAASSLGWTADYSERLLWLIFAALVTYLWLFELDQSFWLDETLTWWVVSGTFTETVQRAVDFQGQSPFYYLILWMVIQAAGADEPVLRLLSVAAMLGSCWMICAIGRDLFSKEAGLAAAIIFCTVNPVVDAAVYARPYALAMFFALSATRFLLKWLSSDRNSHLILYIASSTAALYAHYLFVQFFLIHVLCIAFSPGLGSRKIVRFIGALWGIFILLTPAMRQILSLYQRRQELSFAPIPSWEDLGLALCVPHILLPLLVGIGFSKVCLPRQPVESRVTSAEGFPWWVTAWFLLPPMLFFFYSRISAQSLFSPRYYICFAPGLALFGAWLSERVRPRATHAVALVVFGVFAVQVHQISPKLISEDWKNAAVYAQEFGQYREMPLLYFSGIVEARNTAALSDPLKQSYFLAPLKYYRFPGKPVILPISYGTPEVRQHWKEDVEPVISKEEKVMAVVLENMYWTAGGQILKVPDYLNDQMRKNGFVLERAQKFRRVMVMVFTRAGLISQPPPAIASRTEAAGPLL